MAISIVQTATGTGNPPVTFASPVTVGNTVILVAPVYNTTGGTNSITGVKLGTNVIPGTIAFFNNATTGGINSASSGGNVAYISIWMLPNIQVSGQTAVDYTPSGSQVGQVAFEVAGLGTSPSLDQSASNSGIVTGAVVAGPTGAITGAPELIVGGAMIFAGATGAPAGFTTANPTGDCWAGYQIATSSGGTYTWSQTSNGNPWAVALATVLGTPTPPTPLHVVISAPYRPPPPPSAPPEQFLTALPPPAPAELAGIVLQDAVPYLPPSQVAPQVLTGQLPAGTSGQVQPAATFPLPRRSSARGLWGGQSTPQPHVPGQVQPRATVPLPRRYPARAVWAGQSTPQPHVPGSVQPHLVIARRAAARALWSGTITRTANALPVAVPAPKMRPRITGRASVRAMWRGCPPQLLNAKAAVMISLGQPFTDWGTDLPLTRWGTSKPFTDWDTGLLYTR